MGNCCHRYDPDSTSRPRHGKKTRSRQSSRCVPLWQIEMISKHPSYHGPLTGEEAEQRLKLASVDCYLTRYSERRSSRIQSNEPVYVISVVRDIDGERRFEHFDLIIEKDDNDVTTYEINGAENKMKNIHKLLKFYKNTPVDHYFSGIGDCLKRDGTVIYDQDVTTFDQVESTFGGALLSTPDSPSSVKREPVLEDLVDIMPVVCGKWREIGIRTGQEDLLDGYARKDGGQAECCERVFRVWIANGGHPPKYPHTWQGLYNLLCDIKHERIANKIASDKPEQGIKKRS